jgi:cysteine desulfuration protein SufE
MHFIADSNTAITKGIISLLVRVFHNQKPEDIIAADLSFIDNIQLRSMLTSQRANGLASMIQKMKWYAEVYPTAL